MGRRRTAEAKPVESDVGLEQPTGGESAAAPRDDAPPPPSQGFGDGEDTLQDGDGANPAKSGWGDAPAKSGWGDAPTGAEARAGGIAADFDDPDDAPKFTGVSRRKASTQGFMDTGGDDAGMRGRGGPNRSKHDEHTEEMQILEIPELETEADEDITRQVAAVPKFRSNRVQTINELDKDSHIALPTNSDSEIDFSLLTSVLCSLDQVREDDEVWNEERLLAELASDLNLEKEAMERDETSDTKTPDETTNKDMM